jgi:hypothetical protein
VTRNTWNTKALLGALVLALGISAQGKAESVTYEQIATTSTSIPGGSGDFSSFVLPELNGNYVTFLGTGTSNQEGVYVWSQSTGLQLVSNSNINGNVGPVVDTNGTVAFVANNTIYTGVGGGTSLNPIVTSSTLLPGSPGGTASLVTSLDSRSIAISNGQIAFESGVRAPGGNIVDQGIYTVSSSGGPVSLVANRETVNSTFLNGVALNKGQVLFESNNGSSGGTSYVYALINNSLVKVVDSTQALPGTTSHYVAEESSYITPGSIANGRVAFYSGTLGYFGMNQNGTLVDLATTNDSATAGGLKFIDEFGLTLNSNGSYLFGAQTTAGTAIYYSDSFTNDDYVRLLGSGDILDGKTVADVATVPYTLDGNNFVADVTFTDGSQALVEGTLSPSASVPEPSSILLLAAGVTALVGCRVRSRRSC